MKKTANHAKKAVKNFLIPFKELDYDKMYAACTPTWRLRNRVEALKDIYTGAISGYRIVSAKKITEVVYDIKVVLVTTNGEQACLLRVICETAPYVPSAEGEFMVNPVSFRRV